MDLITLNRYCLLGAIIGDISGSRFEFNNIKNKNFTFLTKDCFFTDDTVMTLAVAKSLCSYDKTIDRKEIKRSIIGSMHNLGEKYPDCGYGGHFKVWIKNKEMTPYNSFGNGSAMRVSPVAWVAESLEEAEELAKITAEITHNHSEGIKGAVATAGSIFLARNGASKKEIMQYMSNYYDLDFTLDEIRPTYSFSEICQTSVPQAFKAFLEGESFEDVIRSAISIGGDSDTIAAIAGSIAECYYEIDETLIPLVESYLDEPLLEILEDFSNKYFYK